MSSRSEFEEALVYARNAFSIVVSKTEMTVLSKCIAKVSDVIEIKEEDFEHQQAQYKGLLASLHGNSSDQLAHKDYSQLRFAFNNLQTKMKKKLQEFDAAPNGDISIRLALGEGAALGPLEGRIE